MRGWARWVAFAALSCVSSGCDEPAAAPRPEDEPRQVLGDAARGRRRMAELECHRCHTGSGLPDVPLSRACVGCHRAIDEGAFDASAATLARWRSHLHSLPAAPDLRGVARLDPAWLARFLLSPHDVRGALEATMPRYPLSESDAQDLAAALTTSAPDAPDAPDGDAERGARWVRAGGCRACHERDVLAPPLDTAAARMTRPMLVAWLTSPRSVVPSTTMPETGLTAERAADVAAYLETRLRPVARPPVPPRLPPLAREVRFDEVAEQLLFRVCRHCHADPAYAPPYCADASAEGASPTACQDPQDDGGAGNTGGFGFAPRGLDLSSYAGVRAGSFDATGERASVAREVVVEGERMPLLVAVLRARQLEEAGRPVPGITGMPWGLPAVTPEVLQLVETWVRDGRPR